MVAKLELLISEGWLLNSEEFGELVRVFGIIIAFFIVFVSLFSLNSIVLAMIDHLGSFLLLCLLFLLDDVRELHVADRIYLTEGDLLCSWCIDVLSKEVKIVVVL